MRSERVEGVTKIKGRTLSAVIVFACITPAMKSQEASTTRNVIQSLRSSDSAASVAAFGQGFANSITQRMTEDAVLLLEGAPIVSGRMRIQELLAAQPSLRGVRMTWQPLLVLTSLDGQLGVTFGTTVRYPSSGEAVTLGRYVSVWRILAGAWKLAAHVQLGLLSQRDLVLPREDRATAGTNPPADAFAVADFAFARMARDSGAPTAFYHFSAPDAMTLAPTGELNIGPTTIQTRLREGPAGTAAWRWWPVITIAARSGDLGATIGESEIQLSTSNIFYSKYITVWRRQRDQSLKFVIDAGSARPRTR